MAIEPHYSTASRFSPVMALLLLTGVFVAVCPIFAWAGYSRHGSIGIFAALAAGAICWVAGLAALGVIFFLREPTQAINAVGLAMLVRMATAMGAGFLLTTAGGPLAEAGVFGMIVGFYLVGLLVETVLAVRLVAVAKQEQASKSS